MASVYSFCRSSAWPEPRGKREAEESEQRSEKLEMFHARKELVQLQDGVSYPDFFILPLHRLLEVGYFSNVTVLFHPQLTDLLNGRKTEDEEGKLCERNGGSVRAAKHAAFLVLRTERSETCGAALPSM